jgi:Carboxypeptidase regulatory-like domain
MGAYIERNHRSGETTHVQDVGGGCDDCRNNNDDKYRGVWLVNSNRRSGLAYAATCRCKTPTVNPDVQPIRTWKVSRDCSSEEIFIGSGINGRPAKFHIYAAQNHRQKDLEHWHERWRSAEMVDYWFRAPVALMFIFVVMAVASLRAQTSTTGDIAGVVTDPTAAVVPGVSVTLKNVDNGSSTSTTAYSQGSYNFPLPRRQLLQSCRAYLHQHQWT